MALFFFHMKIVFNLGNAGIVKVANGTCMPPSHMQPLFLPQQKPIVLGDSGNTTFAGARPEGVKTVFSNGVEHQCPTYASIAYAASSFSRLWLQALVP